MPPSRMLQDCTLHLQVGKKAKEAGAAASAASKKAGRAAKAAARDPQVSVHPMHLHLANAQTQPVPHSWVGPSEDSRPLQSLKRCDVQAFGCLQVNDAAAAAVEETKKAGAAAADAAGNIAGNAAEVRALCNHWQQVLRCRHIPACLLTASVVDQLTSPADLL